MNFGFLTDLFLTLIFALVVVGGFVVIAFIPQNGADNSLKSGARAFFQKYFWFFFLVYYSLIALILADLFMIDRQFEEPYSTLRVSVCMVFLALLFPFSKWHEAFYEGRTLKKLDQFLRQSFPSAIYFIFALVLTIAAGLLALSLVFSWRQNDVYFHQMGPLSFGALESGMTLVSGLLCFFLFAWIMRVVKKSK